MLILLHVLTRYSCQILMKHEFLSADSCKMPKYQILLGAVFFHADRRTNGWMDE